MLFQRCHIPQRLAVVFKRRAVIMHPFVQCLFTGMSKGRMSQIMCKGYALRQVFVQSQSPCNIAADLRDFQGVRDARSVVITFSNDEHLRLSLEPPECLRVNDPVAITLKRKSRFIFRFRLYSSQQSLM